MRDDPDRIQVSVCTDRQFHTGARPPGFRNGAVPQVGRGDVMRPRSKPEARPDRRR